MMAVRTLSRVAGATAARSGFSFGLGGGQSSSAVYMAARATNQKRACADDMARIDPVASEVESLGGLPVDVIARNLAITGRVPPWNVTRVGAPHIDNPDSPCDRIVRAGVEVS